MAALVEPAIPAALFAKPLFADLAKLADELGVGDIESLNRLLAREQGRSALRFAAQTPQLLADGLHYEQRIAERGEIATREASAHDAFNALVWLRHTHLKRAMNARQVADIARVGPKQRTRGQCALTHFDEAGAIVWLDGDGAVADWNAHDWYGLFRRRRAEWGVRIAVTVIGHALFEYALDHDALPVAKALAVSVDVDELRRRCTAHATVAEWPDAERVIAAEIEAGRVLADPQELRPLPLAGIPGWDTAAQTDAFYATAPCFRPLRAGRRYPPPLALSGGGQNSERKDVGGCATVG